MNQIMQVFAIPVVQALLWLVAALVVAAIARALAVGIVKRTGLRARLAKGRTSSEEGERSYALTLDSVGKLVFLFVFLLFVPAIFATLGVNDAGEPVLRLLDSVWGFVPNILAAGIILMVGMMIARLARQLLVPLFSKINVDRLQQRAGIAANKGARLSTTLADIVYVLIVVPVIITALQVLDISVISDPATQMLGTIIGFVPNALAATILVIIGVFVARIAGNLVAQLLSSTGIDSKAESAMAGRMANVSVSKVSSYVVQAVIIVLFVVEGMDILGLTMFAGIGGAVLAYLPNVLAALLVFGAAAFLVGLVGKALHQGSSARYVPFAQAGIWVLAAVMVLSQLNIAAEIVQWGFLLVVGAVAVAFALAFGLGGRDFARKELEQWSGEDGIPMSQPPSASASSANAPSRRR